MADLTDDELMAAIGDVPIRFWMCPVRQHGDRTDDSGWPVVTVEWQGDIARCTAPGCGRTSRPGPADSTYTPDPAPYFCPTAGDVETPGRGGFDACCDAPQLHQPVPADADVDLVAGAMGDRHDYFNRRNAMRALAALAGRLLPADAETRTERQYKYVLTYADGTKKHRRVDSLDVARAVAASPAQWDPPGQAGEVFYSDVTKSVGPWLPAPTEESR